MAENLKLAKALREAEMRPTPRSGLTGMLADALMGARNFADRAKVPDFVPLIGGEGVGSLLVGKAPEEVNELSYGNSPIQMNPYAGRTASFVPEMKRGRGQQLADALSLLSLPGGKTAASMMMGAVPGVDAAATVFHGSPHKFDRFDSSKIGTGEGAQAYGHGLYLAESPDVANTYKLAGVDAVNLVGRDGGAINLSALPQPLQKALNANAGAPDLLGNAQRFLANKFNQDYYSEKYGASSIDDAVKALNDLRASGVSVENPGSLYKVDLPDEAIAKMLDWDKPLSQQPAAAKHFKEMHELNGGQGYINSDGNYTALGVGSTDELKGKDLVDFLAKMGGGRVDASALLRQAGIPGIRYLDAGSRGQGQGSSNYVVFPGNESLLTILERNGQLLGTK
jgi:hypothetical protein